jgi:surface antigen
MNRIRSGPCRLAVICACAASTLLVTETLSAANTWFTRDMPISRMNAEDIGIMQSAVFETLDTAADGQTRHWENRKTGAHGDLTPRATFTDAGMRCRDLEIENSAGGLNNRSNLTLCKTADGWKIKAN